MRNEDIGTRNGRAWIEPAGIVKAGERKVWRIVYEAGPDGIRQGGSVRFEFPYGFPLPQWQSDSDEGYIKVECSREDVELRLSYEIPVPKADEGFFYVTRWGRMVYVQVVQGELKEGDRIVVTYGREFHCTTPGVKAQHFAQFVEFTVATDVDGTRSAKFSGYTLVSEEPAVEVVGGEPEQLVVFGPTLLRPGEEGVVKVIARDKYGNTALTQPLLIKAQAGAGVEVSVEEAPEPVRVSITAKERSSAPAIDGRTNPYAAGEPDVEALARERTVPAVPRKIKVRPQMSGLMRVEVEAPEEKLCGQANPCVVEEREDELRIFWGDPHGHTRLSDGLGTPESYYAFARDEAALDFAAIADHSQYMSDDDWLWIQEATKRFNVAGEFVTLLGYEYSLNARKPHYGDKCIYYPGDEGPLLRATDILRTEYADMAEHAEEWKRHGAMMIVHQHARGTCSFYDSDLVRLCEVYSVWGASEGPEATRELLPSRVRDYSGHWGRDALAKGWILGFCGGSDDHAGRPGNTNWLRRSTAWPGGLTAVWARELSRQAIWQAMWHRRCYATTGARIFLEFSVNGQPMGSVIQGGEETVVGLKVRVCGTAPLEKVEILRNGEVIDARGANAWDVAYEIEDRAVGGASYWYVRVWQQDGEMAWSSPIWVVVGE